MCLRPPRKEMSRPGPTDPRTHGVSLMTTPRSGDGSGWQKIDFPRTVDFKMKSKNRSELMEQGTMYPCEF